MNRGQKFVGLMAGVLVLLLAVASPVRAGEVKIALGCPPDIEKCGTYV
ncbi:MAG: hypothetical protein JRJ59_12990 [Deltaproteobacteria bacterium]|nr:hypothetical protein [Deltaproteobacteria bacterium]